MVREVREGFQDFLLLLPIFHNEEDNTWHGSDPYLLGAFGVYIDWGRDRKGTLSRLPFWFLRSVQRMWETAWSLGFLCIAPAFVKLIWFW